MTPAATSALAAGSLVAGYAAAAASGVRELGGLVLLAGAAACAVAWRRQAGGPTSAGLVALYAGAFVASHPLAGPLGAWPAVLAVAAVVGGLSYAVTRRRSPALV